MTAAQWIDAVRGLFWAIVIVAVIYLNCRDGSPYDDGDA